MMQKFGKDQMFGVQSGVKYLQGQQQYADAVAQIDVCSAWSHLVEAFSLFVPFVCIGKQWTESARASQEAQTAEKGHKPTIELRTQSAKRRSCPFEIDAMVILPDHMHPVWSGRRAECECQMGNPTCINMRVSVSDLPPADRRAPAAQSPKLSHMTKMSIASIADKLTWWRHTNSSQAEPNWINRAMATELSESPEVATIPASTVKDAVVAFLWFGTPILILLLIHKATEFASGARSTGPADISAAFELVFFLLNFGFLIAIIVALPLIWVIAIAIKHCNAGHFLGFLVAMAIYPLVTFTFRVYDDRLARSIASAEVRHSFKYFSKIEFLTSVYNYNDKNLLMYASDVAVSTDKITTIINFDNKAAIEGAIQLEPARGAVCAEPAQARSSLEYATLGVLNRCVILSKIRFDPKSPSNSNVLIIRNLEGEQHPSPRLRKTRHLEAVEVSIRNERGTEPHLRVVQAWFPSGGVCNHTQGAGR
jgi:hypothetical protein